MQLPTDMTQGCRTRDGAMWISCTKDRKPGIAVCEHPGNWINPPTHRLVAVFEKEADRDFVLQLHKAAVTGTDSTNPS